MSWRDHAACRSDGEGNYRTAEFYPRRGGPILEAKEVCMSCPVRADCLEAGLYEKFGIWGGLSERQRRKVRAERARERLAEAG